MRKEVLAAIVLGFALGLVITFGIWSANRAMREKEQEESAGQISEEQAQPTPAPAFSLLIVSPEDESLQTKEKIILSGTTEPDADIIIISQVGEMITQADETGKFEAEITLESGTNEISITAANEAGHEATKNLNLVYASET